MRHISFLLAGCLSIAFLASGCDRSSDAEDDGGKKKVAKKKAGDKISPLAGKLGVFDDGRIEVPLPKGWKESVNEENSDKDVDKNLARMSGEGIQRYPGILIKVREYDDFKTLGEPDLRKFVRNRSKEVAEEKGFKKKIDVKAKSIKGFHGAEYLYTARISGKSFERLVLETVVDSRLYVLELTTLNALREDARPDLYAVASGLKFPKMTNKPSRGRGSASAEEEDEEATEEEAADEDAADEEMSEDDEKAGEEDSE
jgi:hypothetical protein